MMKFRGHLRFWFLLLLCSFILAGCWDRRELEERTSLLAIAIDMSEENPKLYKITVQIPIPTKIAGSGGTGGGKGGDTVRVMSSTGKTVIDAANNLQNRLNQRIFLGHTRVVAVSEDVARKGLTDIIDGFRRNPQMRRLLWPIVVKGKASHLLEIQPKISQIPIAYVMDMIESGSKLQIIPDQTLGNFYIQSSSSRLEPFLNYMEATKNDVAWKGIAVFKGDKLVGVLPDTLSWVLLQLSEKKRGGNIVVPIQGKKGEYLAFHPKVVKTKVNVEHTPNARGGHKVSYLCKLQGDIMETTYHTNLKDEDLIPIYQKLIKEELDRRAKSLLIKLQKEYKTDVLKLGSIMHAYHYQDYWVNHHWNEDFPKMEVSVVYDVRIRRLGMEMR
ncbi:Ger(x)C family spore germination protein [Brevibacillus ginsengisoli]|uniref:Ger(x)C family spore germination protein n=1 Tax=Brevibacillus ginsengisoli TaxID=363854 RepID=UPI003CEEF95E